jgi:MFS family permease
MAVSVFHADALGYGLLSSIMALGTVAAALLGARRERPRFGLLLVGAGVFGLGCTLAAIAPGYWFFAGALVIIGMAALTFTNTTNSLMQLSTEPAMRGRVMALRVGIALGGTPIGPRRRVGRQHLRSALGPWRRAASSFIAALVAWVFWREPDEDDGGEDLPRIPVARGGGQAGRGVPGNWPAPARRPSAVGRRAPLGQRHGAR